MRKPSRRDALWFRGGDQHRSRHSSPCLALQLKARTEGLPAPVFWRLEVHHKG